MTLLNSCGRLRLLSNLVNFHPLPIGRLCPEWVRLLVRGGSSHGNEGKEWKHFGGSLKGNDGARDAGNLKYPTTGDLRIVRVVGKVTVRATCLE